MTRSTLLRASATLAVLCATGLGNAPAVHADTAPAPTETVIPSTNTADPRTDGIYQVDPGGFLHQPQGVNDLLWTSYSGGETRVSPLGGHPPTYGADAVTSLYGQQVRIHDVDAGTDVTLTVPNGDIYFATVGSRVVSYTPGNNAVAAVHVLGWANGQQTETTLTGWPSGTLIRTAITGDADSLLVSYTDSTGFGAALLDLTSDQVTRIVAGLKTRFFGTVLTDQYVGWYLPTSQSTLHLAARSNPGAQQTAVALPTPAIANAQSAVPSEIAGVGGDLLIKYAVTYQGTPPPDASLGNPLYLMPVTGGALSPVLDHVASGPFQAPGSVLVIGGPSASDWAMRRFTEASDGTLISAKVYSETQVPYAVRGLSLSQGQLYSITGVDPADEELTSGTVQWGGTTPTYGGSQPLASPYATDCSAQATCEPPLAFGSNGSVAQLTPGQAPASDVVTVWNGADRGTNLGSTWTADTGTSGGTLVDADAEWAVTNGTNGLQYISDVMENGKVWSRPDSGAALVDSSFLWAADTTPGSVSLINLNTRQTEQTVRTGAACVPAELRTAADRWLYWTCGSSGPAGVLDLATDQDIRVPSGIAQLGDGYVVTHDTVAGKLLLTDVHSDSAVTTDLADLPAGPVPDDRRVTWTVDSSGGGGIAYVDARNDIHLVDPHIPASAQQPEVSLALHAGESLTPGHSIDNGYVNLVMQTDGNLVAYLNGAHAPLWSSNTSSHPGAYALMQPDGNLVVYRSGGGPSTGGALWATGTSGHPGAYTILQGDSNLVVYLPNGTAAWSTGTYQRNATLTAGAVLPPGSWFRGGRNMIAMQPDGNLVIYGDNGAVRWSSGTGGHPGAYATMQSDGNFVVYRKGGGPATGGALWSTRTYGHPGAYAIAQDDGNFVVYREGGGATTGGALWASGTIGQ